MRGSEIMAQYTDILGNKHFSEDKVICIPIDRYNELIIKEHEYDKQNKVKCVENIVDKVVLLND
jgi:hypothetical protein